MKSASLNIRLDPDVKLQAESVLGQLGLSPSTVIDMLYRQIILRQGLPFEARLPNAKTRQALAELDEGKGHRAASVSEMLAKLKDGPSGDA